MQQPKRLLVTGGCGFIGSAFIFVRKLDSEIIHLTNGRESFDIDSENFENINNLYDNGQTFVICEIDTGKCIPLKKTNLKGG